MMIQSAIDLINNIVYKPGWKFSVEDHTNRFEGAIKLRIDYPACNTDRDCAREGYQEQIETYAHFPVIVADCDDEELWRRVLGCIAEIDEHERREAFRIKPTFWAPFHPHQIDGMARWGDPAGDLKFGIA